MNIQLAPTQMRELVTYTQRRWDSYHTAKATKFSIILALALGGVGRLIFWIAKDIPIEWKQEFPVLAPIVFILLGLMCLLDMSGNWLLEQYNKACEIILTDAYQRIEKPDLEALIPCMLC